MSLFTAINQHLSENALLQLADASAMPPAAARDYCAVVVPALVRQLAEPTDSEELVARWDMCRQLFMSQLLTDANELLRTDLGWPDRRRYLAQKVLGANQVTALSETTTRPAQAVTLLGYLTILALAVVGEQAHSHNLDPTALGPWLQAQEISATAPAASSRPATRTLPPSAPAPKLASSSGNKIKVLSAVGALALVGIVGGYFLLGTPANAEQATHSAVAEATTPASEASAPVEPVAAKTEAPAAPEPAAASMVAPPAAPAAMPSAVPAHAAAATAAKAGLRDTVGNAAMARQIGGKFNVALGRYQKGEGQPLLVKLVDRATLTVGINSTESLLYKRLASPTLPRPNDIALDRLSFDTGQARLGAEGAQQLGNVASLLKTFPKIRLLVVGHANNKEAQAIRLGLQRATAAVDELVKQGISADRLQAQGMLATDLPTDNDSAEKQAMLQGISLKVSRL